MGKTKTLLITTATVAAVAGTVHMVRKSRAEGDESPAADSPEPYPAGPYRGGRRSRTIHAVECRYSDSRKPARVFDSIQGALDAGYRPCKVCLG